MKTLIVYDSVFGNTAQVAATMGQALAANVLKVSDVTPDDIQGVSLLIVGSPTRAFRPTPAVTAWLKSLPHLSGMRIAAFDTRIDIDKADSKFLRGMVKLFGYAAAPIQKTLVKKGGTPAADAAWFYVSDNEGPLMDGERARAEQWATSAAKE